MQLQNYYKIAFIFILMNLKRKFFLPCNDKVNCINKSLIQRKNVKNASEKCINSIVIKRINPQNVLWQTNMLLFLKTLTPGTLIKYGTCIFTQHSVYRTLGFKELRRNLDISVLTFIFVYIIFSFPYFLIPHSNYGLNSRAG